MFAFFTVAFMRDIQTLCLIYSGLDFMLVAYIMSELEMLFYSTA